MRSLARNILDRIADGQAVSPEDIEAIPKWQWEIYGPEIADVCPMRVKRDDRVSLQRNALRCDFAWADPQPRCSLQSPDGRGYAWLNSGGPVSAYGACKWRACPLIKGETK